MQRRIDLIRVFRRWLPAVGSLTAASAVAGDPAPLLELRRTQAAGPTTAGVTGATDAAKARHTTEFT